MYSYFAVALISEQEVTNIPHIGVPIFLILKFIFFFGWLEVAKAIDDPWDGNDHEDFKVDTQADHFYFHCFRFGSWSRDTSGQLGEACARSKSNLLPLNQFVPSMFEEKAIN